MTFHHAHGNSTQVIFRIKSRRNNVRYWFNGGGELVAVWQGRNGKSYAVGHNRLNQTIVYRAGDVDWSRGYAERER